MTMPELRNCRAPQCRYKAPVCQYGYCGPCCRKHHTYASVGALTNHKTPDFGEGFKIIERGYTRPDVSTKEVVPPETPVVTTVTTPPVCGNLTEVTARDYPIEDNTNRYYHSF